jgi:hypothetical protein
MDDEESNKALSSRENSPARNGAGQPEVIDLDDDDDVIIEEPPAKRQRPETSPIPEDPKNTTLEKVEFKGEGPKQGRNFFYPD